MGELVRCRLCKSKPRNVSYSGYERGFAVMCDNDNCPMVTHIYIDRKRAIAEWNAMNREGDGDGNT